MSKQRAKLCYEKGYRVDPDGEVITPSGKLVICPLDDRGYRRFSVKADGRVRKVGVHALMAYQKHGDAYMVDGIVARHLDSDKLNNRADNIGIGTHSENSMDRPEKQRRDMAAVGRRKYSKSDVASWREMHAAGIPFRQIEVITGVRRSMLSYHLSKNAKLRSYSMQPKPDDTPPDTSHPH